MEGRARIGRTRESRAYSGMRRSGEASQRRASDSVLRLPFSFQDSEDRFLWVVWACFLMGDDFETAAFCFLLSLPALRQAVLDAALDFAVRVLLLEPA